MGLISQFYIASAKHNSEQKTMLNALNTKKVISLQCCRGKIKHSYGYLMLLRIVLNIPKTMISSISDLSCMKFVSLDRNFVT